MATTRLRKTFKYPSDDEDHSDASRDEMDEEEQEALLTNFRTHDTSQNVLYTLIFTLLPLATLPGFFFYLLSSANGRTGRLLCLLGMTSLGVSAFCMRFLPPGALQTRNRTPRQTALSARGLLQQQRATESNKTSSTFDMITIRISTIFDTMDRHIDVDPHGPLPTYLPWLNTALVSLLTVAAYTVYSRGKGPEGFWLFLVVPGIMWGMVSVARQSMKEVQREIGGLEGLRYGLKGA